MFQNRTKRMVKLPLSILCTSAQNECIMGSTICPHVSSPKLLKVFFIKFGIGVQTKSYWANFISVHSGPA